MERDFDALAKDLQANLTSMGCINKDVRSSLPHQLNHSAIMLLPLITWQGFLAA